MTCSYRLGGAVDHLYDPTNPVDRPGVTTSTSTRRPGFSSAGRVPDESAGPGGGARECNASRDYPRRDPRSGAYQTGQRIDLAACAATSKQAESALRRIARDRLVVDATRVQSADDGGRLSPPLIKLAAERLESPAVPGSWRPRPSLCTPLRSAPYAKPAWRQLPTPMSDPRTSSHVCLKYRAWPEPADARIARAPAWRRRLALS